MTRKTISQSSLLTHETVRPTIPAAGQAALAAGVGGPAAPAARETIDMEVVVKQRQKPKSCSPVVFGYATFERGRQAVEEILRTSSHVRDRVQRTALDEGAALEYPILQCGCDGGKLYCVGHVVFASGARTFSKLYVCDRCAHVEKRSPVSR